MNIRLHIFLNIVYQALTFLLSFYIGAKITRSVISFLPGDWSDWAGWPMLPIVIITIICFAKTHLWFEEYIVAGCPKCGSIAEKVAKRPITYKCQACGYTHISSIHEGGGSGPSGSDAGGVAGDCGGSY